MKSNSLAKRALALALSMVMCVGMLQITALAVEGDEGSEPNAITDTGVPVQATEPMTTPTEDDTKTEYWAASGTDEKGVQVDIQGSTSTTDIPAQTDDEGNVTEPGKTETTTEIDTTLTQEGEFDKDPENAAPEKGTEPELKGDGPKDLGSEDTDLEIDLEASATVRPGDTASTGTGTSGNIKDQIMNILQNDSGLNDCQKDENLHFDKSDNNDGSTTYVANTKDENGNPQTITITIYEDGSYTKTIRTEETKKGEVEYTPGEEKVVEGKVDTTATSNNTENPLPEVPTEVKPEVPTVGDTVNRGEYTETVSSVEKDEETGDYTITYEYQLPVVDSEGNPVPALDAEGNPIVDENGDAVYATTTETRTEVLKSTYDVTTTEQDVTAKREDTVTITEVTVEKKVELGDGLGGGNSLDLNLSMEPVEYEFGKGGHGTLYQDKDTEEGGTWIEDNESGDYNQKTELKHLEEKFGLITVNDITGTKVTVKQEKANDTNFKADVVVDFSVALTTSKLTGNDLCLVIKQGDVTKTAYLGADAAKQNDIDVTLQYNDAGQITGVKFANVAADSFALQLTGRQKLSEEINNGDTNWAQIDMTSKVNVKVSGVTAKITGTTETKTGERVDTLTATRTDKKTVISSSVTSVLDDFKAPTVRPDPEQPDLPDEGGETTPPTTPGGGGGTGGGGGGGDTPVIDVPDPDVPLTDLPETPETPETPEEEVIIPDDDVPLAEGPEGVDILDEDVPLAAVPQTGDISSLWYLATLASACGLGALTLRKKEG